MKNVCKNAFLKLHQITRGRLLSKFNTIENKHAIKGGNTIIAGIAYHKK